MDENRLVDADCAFVTTTRFRGGRIAESRKRHEESGTISAVKIDFSPSHAPIRACPHTHLPLATVTPHTSLIHAPHSAYTNMNLNICTQGSSEVLPYDRKTFCKGCHLPEHPCMMRG
jgi:hypothetical protein